MPPYLYFALDLGTQRIKIGCSKGDIFSVCPVARVRSFGEKVQFVGCTVLPYGADGLGLKRQLQKRFECARAEGDWFYLSEALKGHILSESRGHICEGCAGETVEKREAANEAADAAVAEAFKSF